MRIRLANTLVNQAPTYLTDSFDRGGGIEGFTNFLWGKAATDWVVPILWSIARKYPKGVFGEIGTQGGMTAIAFGMAARDVGGKVYSMDIDTLYTGNAQANIELLGVKDVVTLLHGDSTKTDFPEPLDVLFIDGDHSYEGVKADYERHHTNVKDDGIILFHDPYTCEGVGQLLEEIGAYTIPIESGLGIMRKGHHCPAGEIKRNALGEVEIRVAASGAIRAVA